MCQKYQTTPFIPYSDGQQLIWFAIENTSGFKAASVHTTVHLGPLTSTKSLNSAINQHISLSFERIMNSLHHQSTWQAAWWQFSPVVFGKHTRQGTPYCQHRNFVWVAVELQASGVYKVDWEKVQAEVCLFIAQDGVQDVKHFYWCDLKFARLNCSLEPCHDQTPHNMHN